MLQLIVVELFSTTFNYVPALFRHALSFPYMFNLMVCFECMSFATIVGYDEFLMIPFFAEHSSYMAMPLLDMQPRCCIDGLWMLKFFCINRPGKNEVLS